MSVEDPFFVVKGDVEKNVQTAKELYERWQELLSDTTGKSSEYDWTSNELRNSLRSIEWDLDDLQETISIVEKNPRKFKIEEKELQQRKYFVERTKLTVKSMKDHLTSPHRNTPSRNVGSPKQSLLSGPHHPMNKYTRLDVEIEQANQQFIEDTNAQQQLMIDQQDDQIHLMGSTVGNLKSMSRQIGSELDEQAIMLDEFAQDMDTTESKMDSVMKKMAKVLHMSNDKRQWCAIAVLLVILLIVVILFIEV